MKIVELLVPSLGFRSPKFHGNFVPPVGPSSSDLHAGLKENSRLFALLFTGLHQLFNEPVSKYPFPRFHVTRFCWENVPSSTSPCSSVLLDYLKPGSFFFCIPDFSGFFPFLRSPILPLYMFASVLLTFSSSFFILHTSVSFIPDFTHGLTQVDRWIFLPLPVCIIAVSKFIDTKMCGTSHRFD